KVIRHSFSLLPFIISTLMKQITYPAMFLLLLNQIRHCLRSKYDAEQLCLPLRLSLFSLLESHYLRLLLLTYVFQDSLLFPITGLRSFPPVLYSAESYTRI